MLARTGQDRAGAENNFQVGRTVQGDEKGSVSLMAGTIDPAPVNGDRGRWEKKERPPSLEKLGDTKGAPCTR